MFPPGIEPGTFRVLGGCDNHYTTETPYHPCKFKATQTWVLNSCLKVQTSATACCAPFDSSVGRAVDCSWQHNQTSIGRWFDSGSKEVSFENLAPACHSASCLTTRHMIVLTILNEWNCHNLSENSSAANASLPWNILLFLGEELKPEIINWFVDTQAFPNSIFIVPKTIHALYKIQIVNIEASSQAILVSIVVSIPACHAGDQGSIPWRGGTLFLSFRCYV